MPEQLRVWQAKLKGLRGLFVLDQAETKRTGTDPAQPVHGTRQPQSLPAGWMYLLMACLLTSCVVLPPTADPPAEVPPLLNIAQVNPPLFTPLVIDPRVAQDFKVEKLETQSVDPNTVQYYWYLDWNVTDPTLTKYAVCQNKARCTVYLCGRANGADQNHTLLAVVSSAAQLDTAATPTDFPAGTAYDAVEWRIEPKGSCPPSP